jgi:glycosyltransferase involved in cell wall biosynthesis
MSRFPKVTETFILFEVLTLQELGWHVDVYPLLRQHDSVAHQEAARVVAQAHYQPFLSWRIVGANLAMLLQRPGAYLGVLAEVLYGTWRSRNFFVGALGIFAKSVRMARQMQRSGVQHLHAHFATHPAVAAFIVHRLTGIPFSFTAHGSDLHVDRTMLAQKVRAAEFVVTVSGFNRDVIVKECGAWAAAKVQVVHCGVDLAYFAAGNGRRANGSDPQHAAGDQSALRIVCVASFEEVKGHRYLIEACQRLRGRGVALRCDLIGEGPEQAAVAAQVQDLGLTDVVQFHGPRPRHEVLDFLRSADVKVLASVPTRGGKREGVPVVLMEAMACEVPVVSSRLSGIPELVEDGVSGLLVEPRDVDALVEALARLAADPALRVTLGREGRRKVEREFDLRANARLLAACFDARP